MTRPRTTFRLYLILLVKGFCMGSADVIPGVSGGTMAFVLGIYRELVTAIRSFDISFLRLLVSGRVREAWAHVQWRFLLAVGAGILLAIFTLARFLSWALERHPVLIWSFFFGLIVASVLTVSRSLRRFHASLLPWLALGTAGTYVLVGLVPARTPDAAWFLFLAGAVAICAMILPGISGAFILVLLGKYQTVLEAVNRHDAVTLLWVAAGAAAGLVLFSRFLSWLFTRHQDLTIALLTGLMVGSLRKIWPWKRAVAAVAGSGGRVLPAENILPSQADGHLVAALLLALAGFGVVLALDALARRTGASARRKGDRL